MSFMVFRHALLLIDFFQAKDDPGSLLCFYANTTLTVNVMDVNDNPPLFIERPYKIKVPESSGTIANK